MTSVDGQLSRTAQTKQANLEKKKKKNEESRKKSTPTKTPVIHEDPLVWWSNMFTYSGFRCEIRFGRTWLKFSSVNLHMDFELVFFFNGGRCEVAPCWTATSCSSKPHTVNPQLPTPIGGSQPQDGPFASKKEQRQGQQQHFSSANNTFSLHCQRILASAEVNTAASQQEGKGHVMPSLLNSRPGRRASRKTSGRLLSPLLCFSHLLLSQDGINRDEVTADRVTESEHFAVRDGEFTEQNKKITVLVYLKIGQHTFSVKCLTFLLFCKLCFLKLIKKINE